MKGIITYSLILGAAGVVLALPALVLITGGMLFSIFRSPLTANILNPELFIFHPAVIIGGLIASIGLNLSIVLKMRKSSRLNLYVVLGSFLLLGAIFLYLVVENTELVSFIF